MNGQNTYNAVVAMEMGIRKFTTCCPPLAYGSSHPSVFNLIHNAEQLGINHTMDREKLNIIEERLTKIGSAFGHPVDNHPMPFDLFCYKHQVSGGVISNLTTQLTQLGIMDKLQEVLEEIPRILVDLGHPVMITPFSQYIVAQAVLNVQIGRWEQCLDTMVEFAVRIIKACKEIGIQTVLVVSEADTQSMGAKLADEVFCIGPPQVHLSYLDIQKIIKTALETGADAIHPGYGFLAENHELPEACEKNGIIFIGPNARTMRQLGDKISARDLAFKSKVPMAVGSGGLHSFQDVEAQVEKLGFPVIFKAAAGGGGRGMRVVLEPKDFKTCL